MNLRCFWAANAAKTFEMVSVWMSSQGDSSVKGRGRSASPKISSAQIICIQVVPHFEGVEITMSPARNSKSSQRLLSASGDRYRRETSLTELTPLGGDRLSDRSCS